MWWENRSWLSWLFRPWISFKSIIFIYLIFNINHKRNQDGGVDAGHRFHFSSYSCFALIIVFALILLLLRFFSRGGNQTICVDDDFDDTVLMWPIWGLLTLNSPAYFTSNKSLQTYLYLRIKKKKDFKCSCS